MRFINVRELKSKTSEILKAVAEEEVIVTSRGKPIAVVRSVSASEFSWISSRRPATTTAALPPPSSPWSLPAPWSMPAPGAKTSPATEANLAAETRPAAKTNQATQASQKTETSPATEGNPADKRRPTSKARPATEATPAPEARPAAETRPASPWSPLKAAFWDYPELADESGLRRYLEVARQASNQPALDWAVTRLLERGRVVDVRKLLAWKDIRDALLRLRLTPLSRKKWERMVEVYDQP